MATGNPTTDSARLTARPARLPVERTRQRRASRARCGRCGASYTTVQIACPTGPQRGSGWHHDPCAIRSVDAAAVTLRAGVMSKDLNWGRTRRWTPAAAAAVVPAGTSSGCLSARTSSWCS